MGRNFQSETRISGFITKKDVILGGLRTGAIFGSLFGSFLSLLTGVGVLFVPFIGMLIAAGPISAILLGAASGAIAGGVGVGLISALTALGMPEDKATLYQTQLRAGEFLLLTEVPRDRTGEVLLLLETAGAKETHVLDKALTRPSIGSCNSVEDLSPEIRNHLAPEAQQVFMQRYNTIFPENNDQLAAEQSAWDTVHQQFDQDERGVWSKVKVGV
jgi:cation transport regulator ChaB